MTDTPLPLSALRQQRERTIELLCQHFARDHLEAEELERLIDGAHAAATPQELDALLHGLPSLAAVSPHPEAGTGVSRGAAGEDHQVVVAVMGGAERRGSWTPARNLYVAAVMGGAVLDFRGATLQQGVTEIYVLALMGGVEILVPPGIHVESDGIGILGGFDYRGKGRFPVDSSVPTLRILGMALMGGVEIRELEPGEPAGDPHRERRRLRRDLRRLERGEPPDGSNWGGWHR